MCINTVHKVHTLHKEQTPAVPASKQVSLFYEHKHKHICIPKLHKYIISCLISQLMNYANSTNARMHDDGCLLFCQFFSQSSDGFVCPSIIVPEQHV